MAETLTKESATCYRRPPSEPGGKGISIFRREHDVWVRLPTLKRMASIRALKEVSWAHVGEAEAAQQAALKAGSEPAAYTQPAFNEGDRLDLRISGTAVFEELCKIGVISSAGTKSLPMTPFYLSLSPGDPQASNLLYYPKSEHGEEAAFLTLYAPMDRLRWLFRQLDDRPTASLFIRVFFHAWEDELDRFGWRPGLPCHLYLEPEIAHEITDFGFHVNEEEVRDKAERTSALSPEPVDDPEREPAVVDDRPPDG
jgi:hypothetical protein